MFGTECETFASRRINSTKGAKCIEVSILASWQSDGREGDEIFRRDCAP
jgi:hypothetical protein